MDTRLWGKINVDSPLRIHPVICHCIDSGFVAKQIWGIQSPRYKRLVSRAFGVDVNDMAGWLAFLVSIHDLGKLCPAFQKKGLSYPSIVEFLTFDGVSDLPHGLATQCIIEKLGLPLDTELTRKIAAIEGAHHGAFSQTPSLKIQTKIDLGWLSGDYDWQGQQKECLEFLVRCWNIESLHRLQEPSRWNQWAYLVLAGFISRCDWIASSQIPGTEESCFPVAGSNVNPQTYLKISQERAEQVVRLLDFQPYTPPPKTLSFEELFPGMSPRPLQEQCARVFDLLAPFKNPCMVIIEDVTGSGKTEASQYLSQYMIQRFGHDGQYAALPTCASTLQMFQRCLPVANKMSMNRANVQMTCSHANLLLKEVDIEGVTINEWLSKSNRTKLFSDFVVGTIDQICMAIIQSKFFSMRLSSLVNKVVILDEIHSYDVYTSKLIEHLLRWLRYLGCSVIVLSATLTEEARRRFASAFGGKRSLANMEALSNIAYPRITVVPHPRDSLKIEALSIPVSCSKKIRSRVIGSSLEALAKSMRKELRKGGCAVVYRNIVGTAQETYTFLRDKFQEEAEVHLLHARTSSEWRKEDEAKIVSKFGKGGDRPQKAIVVTTQVLEQSLDVDFDIVWSDLAPIDLLLQRMGRCHRHNGVYRPKPLIVPCLKLLIDKVPKGKIPDYGKSIFVYDEYILHRTYLRLVYSNLREITIPNDVQTLINFVYSEKLAKWLSQEWKDELRKSLERREKLAQKATGKAIWRMIPSPSIESGLFAPLFAPGLLDDHDVALDGENVEYADKALHVGWQRGASVRDIPPNAQVVFVQKVGENYVLPPSKKGGFWQFNPNALYEQKLIEKLCNSAINVVQRDVVEYCESVQAPTQWQRTPLVRYLVPVVMDKNWEVRIGNHSLQLNRECGLQILKTEVAQDVVEIRP